MSRSPRWQWFPLEEGGDERAIALGEGNAPKFPEELVASFHGDGDGLVHFSFVGGDIGAAYEDLVEQEHQSFAEELDEVRVAVGEVDNAINDGGIRDRGRF